MNHHGMLHRHAHLGAYNAARLLVFLDGLHDLLLKAGGEASARQGASEGPHHNMVNSQASGMPTAPRSCAGCGGKIADRFLLFSMERYWHTRCLKCSCCQAQLGDIGTTCYSKGGMILCRSDYIRLFGHSGACSACGQSIPANEMVMRAQGNVYHLKCFSCATCRNRLMPGDRFHYINGTIFCEHDRPGAALLNSHMPPLQSNSVLTDQKVC
ncbi:unnamed protein product [Pleuronectes platessa]|uniref:LIM zinc-binding domain-containing protein n=3 Tax=Pleuronectidae TaxID=8256 RepID=A0A9N7W2X9_PLEPL|nr:unnamed protein product [Pleuronectes platessa]